MGNQRLNKFYRMSENANTQPLTGEKKDEGCFEKTCWAGWRKFMFLAIIVGAVVAVILIVGGGKAEDVCEGDNCVPTVEDIEEAVHEVIANEDTETAVADAVDAA